MRNKLRTIASVLAVILALGLFVTGCGKKVEAPITDEAMETPAVTVEVTGEPNTDETAVTDGTSEGTSEAANTDGETVGSAEENSNRQLITYGTGEAPAIDSAYLLELIGDNLKIMEVYEKNFPNNQWEYVDYSVGEEKSYVYPTVLFEVKDSSDAESVPAAMERIGAVLESQGFAKDESRGSDDGTTSNAIYYTYQDCVIRLWDVGSSAGAHNELELRAATGYQNEHL